ncbi:MAG: L-aspartate oxidase [Bacteroidia bacterium]|nr:L-aspartate oxidase [Bacteroidia bacterium]
MQTIKTDFLVIGSGVAGLSYTLKTARALPGHTFTVICKSEPKESNTRYAQGGIAVSLKTEIDSPEKHIKDTLRAGDGLCDKKIVRMVVKEGPEQLRELIKNGVKFDRNRNGKFDLAMEGGHSASRIFHRADFTGLEIERKMLAKVRKMKNVKIMDHASAIDLITNEQIPGKEQNKKSTCYGAYVLLEKKKDVIALLSRITVLATGGVGQVFEHTTNASTATGDGIAMASRAGARIKHMAFIQFHPTALYEKNKSRNFLISEAVRGMGAILRNPDGNSFMEYYDPARDLATRDIVARAIHSELERSFTEFLYLDCRSISKKEFVKHFPTIVARCTTAGIDPSRQMIPVVPSAHYCCGGVSTDQHGRTSLKNLYACGECAETGLHGANRLASNSLLEALVFANRCSVDSVKRIDKIKNPGFVKKYALEYKPLLNEKELERFMSQSKKTMSRGVGLVTNVEKIVGGLKILNEIKKELEKKYGRVIHQKLLTLRNMLDTDLLILEDSVKRRKNAGVFFNENLDFNKINLIEVNKIKEVDNNLVRV